MSKEDFEQHLYMLRYFWLKNGDVTDYADWEKIKPVLMERRPDIYVIITNYELARASMNAAMENLT